MIDSIKKFFKLDRGVKPQSRELTNGVLNKNTKVANTYQINTKIQLNSGINIVIKCDNTDIGALKRLSEFNSWYLDDSKTDNFVFVNSDKKSYSIDKNLIVMIKTYVTERA